MDNGILADLRFDAGRGALLYQEVRYLLIRPETLIAFQKAAEQILGENADALLYAGGFAGGVLSANRYRQVFGLSDEQSVEFMAKMGTEIGWGKMRVSSLNHAIRELELVVESSPFAGAYGKAERGVCHLIRGVFAGLASGIFGRPVGPDDGTNRSTPAHPETVRIVASEPDCLAIGSPCCRFTFRAVENPDPALSY